MMDRYSIFKIVLMFYNPYATSLMKFLIGVIIFNYFQ